MDGGGSCCAVGSEWVPAQCSRRDHTRHGAAASCSRHSDLPRIPPLCDTRTTYLLSIERSLPRLDSTCARGSALSEERIRTRTGQPGGPRSPNRHRIDPSVHHHRTKVYQPDSQTISIPRDQRVVREAARPFPAKKNEKDEARDQRMLSCWGLVCRVQTVKRNECSDEHMTLSSSLTRIPPSLR